MARRIPAPQELMPLTPAVVHILLVLTGGPLHGYAIMKAVERLSEGQMRIGPGTLYGTLKRMLQSELIKETEAPPGEEPGNRPRRYYQLTHSGRQVLEAEVTRLEQLVRAARARPILEQRS